MQLVAFIGTWAVLGASITFWLNDKGLDMLLAVIIGVIGGLFANALAWIIFSSSGSNPFNF